MGFKHACKNTIQNKFNNNRLYKTTLSIQKYLTNRSLYNKIINQKEYTPYLKSLEYKLAKTKALSCYHYYIFVLRNLMIILREFCAIYQVFQRVEQ
ncbi:hypothetical protein VN1276_02590 [Helicobacter pylori]|nr:hypothetical protein VN1276_02590 [Helicobacter pylori]